MEFVLIMDTKRIEELRPKSAVDNYYGIKIAPFSVLMSIYLRTNAAYLNQSIQSVWTDQILKPSEIVIVCDGPITDDVNYVLQCWQKILLSRLIVLRIGVNSGLANALNKGLDVCMYNLVARMDDDDISLPSRFLQQYTYMRLHNEISVLGTQVEERSEDLCKVLSKKFLPLSSEEILKFSRWRSPLNHPSVMFRKNVIKKMGGYPVIYPEDYPLWGKLLFYGYKIENLSEKLLIMRQEMASSGRRVFKFFIGELKVLIYFYRLGHISFIQLLSGLLIRFVVRLSPSFVKKNLYRALK